MLGKLHLPGSAKYSGFSSSAPLNGALKRNLIIACRMRSNNDVVVSSVAVDACSAVFIMCNELSSTVLYDGIVLLDS